MFNNKDGRAKHFNKYVIYTFVHTFNKNTLLIFNLGCIFKCVQDFIFIKVKKYKEKYIKKTALMILEKIFAFITMKI